MAAKAVFAIYLIAACAYPSSARAIFDSYFGCVRAAPCAGVLGPVAFLVMTLLLAPMEGLLDFVLRDVLTRVGGVDRCVSEFIRITGTLLPDKVFLRYVPELHNGSRTLAGVPVRAQLLGSDPVCMAENAARLAALGPEGIDLNFGCPAKVVNRHGGGRGAAAGARAHRHRGGRCAPRSALPFARVRQDAPGLQRHRADARMCAGHAGGRRC